MGKKQIIYLTFFIISTIFIGFILLTGMNQPIEIRLNDGEIIKTQTPINFSFPITMFLIILSIISTTSFIFYSNILNEKIKFNKLKKIKLDILEGDEKKVYEYLLEKKECIQKDLIYELKINKSKTTRLLDKMTQKNLVERISYGNTNKIRLK